MDKKLDLENIVKAAVCAALIIVGARLSFDLPFIPVPITVANLFAVLAGLMAGPIWGTGAVGIYLLLGLAGLPVFAKIQGFAAFMGPTGGFLIGYALAALVAGLIYHGRPVEITKPQHWLRLLTATILGFLVVYLPGLPWLLWVVNQSNPMSLMTGFEKAVLPFLIPDLLKAIVLILVVPLLQLGTRPGSWKSWKKSN